MKLKQTLIALGVAAAVSSSAVAAVGVVDLQKIIQTSPYALRLQKDLKDQFQARKAKLDKLKQSMMAEVADFQKNKAVMTDKKKAAFKKKIMQQRQSYFQDMGALQKDFMAAEKKSSEGFIAKVKGIVKADAQKQKLKLILPTDAVVYAVDEVDLTSDVMKKLK